MQLVSEVQAKILVYCLVKTLCPLRPRRPLLAWQSLRVTVSSVLGFLESNVFQHNSLPEVWRCRCCHVFAICLIALSPLPLNFGPAMAAQVHFFLFELRVLDVVAYFVLRKVLLHLLVLPDEARFRTSHHESDYDHSS